MRHGSSGHQSSDHQFRHQKSTTSEPSQVWLGLRESPAPPEADELLTTSRDEDKPGAGVGLVAGVEPDAGGELVAGAEPGAGFLAPTPAVVHVVLARRTGYEPDVRLVGERDPATGS